MGQRQRLSLQSALFGCWRRISSAGRRCQCVACPLPFRADLTTHAPTDSHRRGPVVDTVTTAARPGRGASIFTPDTPPGRSIRARGPRAGVRRCAWNDACASRKLPRLCWSGTLPRGVEAWPGERNLPCKSAPCAQSPRQAATSPSAFRATRRAQGALPQEGRVLLVASMRPLVGAHPARGRVHATEAVQTDGSGASQTRSLSERIAPLVRSTRRLPSGAIRRRSGSHPGSRWCGRVRGVRTCVRGRG